MSDEIAIKEGADVAVRDKRWLKPWQWAVGLVAPLWLVWSLTESVKLVISKGKLVPARHARRMDFLQLVTVIVTAPWIATWATWVLLGVLSMNVFLLPRVQVSEQEDEEK